MDSDMEEKMEMVRDFVNEARELLDDAEPQIIEMEKMALNSGRVDDEVLNAIFRLFHSIKGTSSFLDFQTIMGVTHEAETLLDLFRKGKAKITPYHVDLLCSTTDFIRSILDVVERKLSDDGFEEDAESLSSDLKQIIAAVTGGDSGSVSGEDTGASSSGEAMPSHPEDVRDTSSVAPPQEIAQSDDYQPETGDQRFPESGPSTEVERPLAAQEPGITPEMGRAFAEETLELCEEAESALLAMERGTAPETTGSAPDEEEPARQAFRAFHSIKGNAGFFGYGDLERISHLAENVLDRFRNSESACDPVAMSVLLETIDAVRGKMSDLSRGGPGEMLDIEQLCDRLKNLESQLPGAVVAAGSEHTPVAPGCKTGIAVETTTEKLPAFDQATAAAMPGDDTGFSSPRYAAPEAQVPLDTPGTMAEACDWAPQKSDTCNREATTGCRMPEADLQPIAGDRQNLAPASVNALGVPQAFSDADHAAASLGAVLLPAAGAQGKAGDWMEGDRAGSQSAKDGASGVVDARQVGEWSAAPVPANLVQPTLEDELFNLGLTDQVPPRSDEAVSGKNGLKAVLESLQPSHPVPRPAKIDEMMGPISGPVPPPEAKEKVSAAPAVSGKGRPAGGDGGSAGTGAQSSVIRVDIDKLDKMLDLVGELVIAELMVANNQELDVLNNDRFGKAVMQLDKISRELQEVAMSMRMIPLAGVFRKMVRLVRDLAQKADKQVDLVIIGEETEVDKTIIEQISDPLVHLIRNAVDHGLETPAERLAAGKPETGRITLEAMHAAGEVWITIEDDGRGLNRDKIYQKGVEKGLIREENREMKDDDIWRLIFEPGFSTAEQVSSISGRGVGMDVVKKNIERLRGKVDIRTKAGVGTVFVVRIPLTLAIIEGMVVRVGAHRYTIPISSIKESFRPGREQITKTPDGMEIVRIRGELQPVLRLHELYRVEPRYYQLSEGILIMVENSDSKCCLFVDELIGQQQIVIKGLPGYLSHVKGVSGCAILGDGEISLILDIAGLIDSADVIRQ